MPARLLLILLLLASPVLGADAPAPGPSTAPHTQPSRLHLQWTRQLPRRKPMWAQLERWPGRDVAYVPVVAGPRLFIGTSHNDALICCNAATGSEMWRFHVEGPIRFAPIAAADLLYCTTDFGHLYCIDAAKGTLLWRTVLTPDARKRMLHDRLVSAWPASAAPVLVGDAVVVAVGSLPADGAFAVAIDGKTGKQLWISERLDFRPWGEITYDGEGVCIDGMGGQVRLDPKNGQRLADRPASSPKLPVLPELPSLDGEVVHTATAGDMVYVATLEGRIYCFGPAPATPQWHEHPKLADAPAPDEATRLAGMILEKTGRREGLCIVMGLKKGRLAEELLRQSKLQVVAIDADPEVVDAARRYFDKQGLYDQGRLAVHLADPLAFGLPDEVADLIVSEDLAAGGFEAGKAFATTVGRALRNGGGTACLPIGPARQDEFAGYFVTEAGFELVRNGEVVRLIRRNAPTTRPATLPAVNP